MGDVRKTSTAYTSTSCNVLGLKRIVFSQEKEILSQALTDMSFCNSFYDAGNLVYFDQEWVYPDVPVEFLLYRNIKYSGVDFSVKERLYREFNIADECRCEYDEIDEIMLQNMMDSGRCNVFDPNMYHIEQTLSFVICNVFLIGPLIIGIIYAVIITIPIEKVEKEQLAKELERQIKKEQGYR